MIEPLEKIDPYLAEQFIKIANNELAITIENGRVFEVYHWYKNCRKITSFKTIKKEIVLNIKRNDSCICGSGKKYKKCCME